MIRFQIDEVTLEPGVYGRRLDTVTYSNDRPIWVTHLRIYQLVPYAMSGDTWSVLRDAIIDGDKDTAGRVLASDSVMPGWRRSAVRIDRFLDYGSARILLQDALAGSVWDVPLDKLVTRADAFQLQVSNPYEYPVTIRPFIAFEPITENELQRARNGQRIDPPRADRQRSNIENRPLRLR
jgi:hypothetical protein